MQGFKPLPITLTDLQKETLEGIVRRQTSEQRLVRRSRIVLLAAQGMSNGQIARKLGIGRQAVCIWRKRWHEAQSEFELVEEKLAQQADSSNAEQAEAQLTDKQYAQMLEELLSDRERSGKPPSFTAEQIVQLIALACKEPQQFCRPVSHWTPRELRDESIKQKIFESISVRQVGRFLKRSRPKTSPKPLLAEF